MRLLFPKNCLEVEIYAEFPSTRRKNMWNFLWNIEFDEILWQQDGAPKHNNFEITV